MFGNGCIWWNHNAMQWKQTQCMNDVKSVWHHMTQFQESVILSSLISSQTVASLLVQSNIQVLPHLYNILSWVDSSRVQWYNYMCMQCCECNNVRHHQAHIIKGRIMADRKSADVFTNRCIVVMLSHTVILVMLHLCSAGAYVLQYGSRF